MARRSNSRSFADIVREVERGAVETPSDTATPAGCLKAPDGPIWSYVSNISAPRALALADSGAVVAWDPCGCGGYCGITWYTPDDVRRLVAAGPPRVKNNKRWNGRLSEWHEPAGGRLVLAEDAVIWGHLLS